MTLISEICIDVIESFKALHQSIEAFAHQMQADHHLPAWFNPPEDLPLLSSLTTREQVITLIRQLEYLDHQKPREILVGAGLIAASQETINSLIQLNVCKDNFKKAMIILKNSDIRLNDEALNKNMENLLRPDITTQALKRFGLSRLHLKQCYRRIPFFTERPTKVSWTWANTRAITRISVEDAKQMLMKQGRDFNTEVQLNKLIALSPNEPLAIVQELAPHLRANIVFKTNPEEERRVMVKGPVPLFYLSDTHENIPDIKPPGQKRGRDKERSVRSDVKLDPEPFLPSIRVHRYL